MIRLTVPLRPSRVVPVLLAGVLAGGCASSAPPTDSTMVTEPESTGPMLLVSDETGVAQLAPGGRVDIQPGARFSGLYSRKDAGRDVIVQLVEGDVARLAALSPDGSLTTIHEMESDARYTVSWSPSGDLAFAYEGESQRGVGIRRADGEISNVGCRASSKALGWASADRPVVGDGQNHYVVEAQGCATVARVDARKMHEAAFNPSRPLVAYILRELAYDRPNRQYVPDSSLYVSNVDGSDPKLVVGDRYKPHRPAWSPDGVDLAFDARLPDDPGRRLISIYDADLGSSAFLNPDAVESTMSEWNPHWSPGGRNIAYLQRDPRGEDRVAVRSLDGSFVTVVGESGETIARWIDENYLVVSNGTSERVVSTDGSTSIDGPDHASILLIR